MSEKLRLCRNMATYLGQFKADPIELNIDFLNNTIAEKKLPAWFFIKPYYELGTLRHYLRERKKKRLELEPLYVLQMAVTLFSILTDAHSQNIGLVDITMDSLYVNTDGGLYFGGFKSCVSLDPESLSKQKDSFDTSSIKCPEIKIIKAGNYMKECDVFLACHVLLQVIQKNFGQYTRLYKQILKAEKIEILREYLNPKFKFLIPVLEQGLCYRYQDRPPASELLVAFESMHEMIEKESLDNTVLERPGLSSQEEKREEEEEQRFYEIDGQQTENPTIKANAPNKAKENHTKDFKRLLENLFVPRLSKPPTQSKIRHLSIPLPEYKKKGNSQTEKALLNMVIHQTKIYKPKATLPRSIMNSIYGPDSKQSPYNNNNESSLGSSPILNFLHQEDKQFNDERIKLKEKEMQTIQAITETKTSSELLECVRKEINLSDDTDEVTKRYPLYYPNLLVKAIEHAISSRNDPYLALTIFEEAKNKSLVSYIFGCTTPVYNAILSLRWNTWRDIYGMLDLVEEMTLNGIEIDDNSRRIIRKVVNEIEYEGNTGLIGEDILKEEESQETISAGLYWNADERRNCHLLTELGGKWLIARQHSKQAR
ncbi:uncharacterized protein BX663DRAFT_426319 [Cokeromyces recurvatus]|uniref:uncharacterized protein n=1 Tax=Cokeromyces recurvatus TaxID=90255 RepID=UPI0022211731|nr:uncharacterized protein BX663DRAFT_426319 [Cokeromyces recurvatus]KAI7907278.1 hypothetical protein BX663DRAFT_426319 [Cokeromyces recurvatus]